MPGSALAWEVADGVALVTIDLKGEPVNKISRSVKDDFLATLEALERDRAVQAVAFFSGKPDTFIAGADIDEFVALTTAAEAERLSGEGQEMLERVARFPKPIAAGIHGACLGGGLEFALACHYRVATDHPKTQLGLPEVQLGILPGAGGCQRLPRLIGVRAALDLILAGKTEPAQRAFRLGIVDELVHPAILRDVTLAAVKRMAGGWRPRRKRLGGVAGWLLDGNPLGRSVVFRTARKQVLKQTGKKDLGVPNAPPPCEVRRLAIVGAGFMGSGIAGTAVLHAGVDVRLKDADLARVAKGLAAARDVIDERLKRRRMTKYEHARLVALLSGGDRYAGFGRADLVIEAVFEDLGVKQQVLREVESVTPEGAVFASNTSTIPIAKIAEASARPEQVIGMHFFSPVPRMPLLEVIPGARTAPQVISTAVAFGRRMGKTPVVVKDNPGFWINRTLLDEVGLDVAEKVAGVMHDAFGERFAPAPAFAGMVKDGRLGRKAGKGFYRYARGKKGAVDSAVYQLIGTEPDGGVRPAEIIQRLVLVMLNEAARALGDGIVRSPRDGDVAAIFGFGFPPFRGGPLRHADDLGAPRVVGELERLAERFGTRFAPCEVLQAQASRGSKFYS